MQITSGLCILVKLDSSRAGHHLSMLLECVGNLFGMTAYWLLKSTKYGIYKGNL